MTEPVISRVAIKGLFGLYNYELPSHGELQSVAILYGDNGTGKTTLLKLVFHLLSYANNRGHRTFLYDADFEELEVVLSSGYTIKAALEIHLPSKLLRLEIILNSELMAYWEYHGPELDRYVSENSEFEIQIDEDGHPTVRPKRKDLRREVKYIGNAPFVGLLREIAPAMYMLNDERRIESDSIEPRRVLRSDEKASRETNSAVAKQVALAEAMRTAASWTARNGLLVANQGSMNVHTAYVTMLDQLTISSTSKFDERGNNDDIATLMARIDKIQDMIDKQSAYELTSPISVREFKKALNKQQNSEIVANLLKPYIKSLESRLTAIEPAYNVVNVFISTLNELLRDKKISYTVSSGFKIINKVGKELAAPNLSSGEQHLLLLFCYILIARDKETVFIIDEPEISLNIKWQRKLIKSLTDIVGNARVQLIFASHSFEILSQYKDCVVHLKNQEGA